MSSNKVKCLLKIKIERIVHLNWKKVKKQVKEMLNVNGCLIKLKDLWKKMMSFKIKFNLDLKLKSNAFLTLMINQKPIKKNLPVLNK